MAKRYYWLKLKDDFFTSKAMKKLRKIAGGDTYTIIYLKMQLLSIQSEGVLYFDQIEPTFAEELALTIDEDVDNVSATLIFLEKCGLIEKASESEFLLTDVPHLIGMETDDAVRQRKSRAKKCDIVTRVSQECHKSVTQVSHECHAPVTKCHTDIDIDIEKDIDIECSRAKNKFCPPTVDEVSAYCLGKGLSVDAERFVDFYQSKNWMVGKNKMKDWKAACRNWSRRNGTTFNVHEQRTGGNIVDDFNLNDQADIDINKLHERMGK